MGISRNLTGTPWHIAKMVRKEGDPRRHRARCCYFRKKIHTVFLEKESEVIP